MKKINRRDLLKRTTGIAAFTILPAHVLGRQTTTAPSNKLNIAGIGLGAQGSGLIQRFKSENIVALCDVDQVRLENSAKIFPNAKTYSDFRKLFDAEKSLDAVVIAAPDHLHAPITM